MTHIWTAVTDSWLPLWAAVEPNWREYTERHGYTLHVQREFNQGLAFTFAKIEAVQKYCQDLPYLDDVWVMDADIVFTNMTVPLGAIADENQYGDILMTKDINGINSGVFYLKYAMDVVIQSWLSTILAFSDLVRSEQDAIQRIAPAFHAWIDYMPHPSFNSIVLDEYPIYAGKYTEKDGNWAPGHLLAHFPGMDLKGRLSLIPKYLAQVVR